MSKHIIIKAILALAIVGFVALGVNQIQSDHEIKLRNEVQLQTTETNLRLKQVRLKEIESELNKQLEQSEVDTKKIDELQDEIRQLEADLQAKKQREAQEAERLANAQRRASGTATVNAAVSGSGSCEAEIRKYNWNTTVALNVARAESGLRADARGDTHLTYYQNGTRYGDSWGCFQIRYLPGRPAPSQLVNAEFNVRYAYEMYRSQNWRPWSVCRNGAAQCY